MTPNPIFVQPVIIAGGSGTRLWPLSRAMYPKQFLVLQGDHSLFQQAARRLASLAARTSAWVRRAWSATRSTASWCSSSCANSRCPTTPQRRCCSNPPAATPRRR